MDIVFFVLQSMLLGLGLSMDAFSVSLANGLNEPKMSKHKMIGISSVFAVFQGVMPMLGWVFVFTILDKFEIFEYFIPWIALGLLGYIGGEMLYHGIRKKEEETTVKGTTLKVLLVQGLATSIDALSVGFTIAEYDWVMALICACIIAVVTFILCFFGVVIGKKFGTKLATKASILGGIILLAIGIEIFISGMISLYA